MYAAAIHSMSLPFRMKRCCGTRDFSSGAADINEIIQMLSGQARKNMVAILDVAMPAPSLLNGKLWSLLKIHMYVSFLPHHHHHTNKKEDLKEK